MIALQVIGVWLIVALAIAGEVAQSFTNRRLRRRLFEVEERVAVLQSGKIRRDAEHQAHSEGIDQLTSDGADQEKFNHWVRKKIVQLVTSTDRVIDRVARLEQLAHPTRVIAPELTSEQLEALRKSPLMMISDSPTYRTVLPISSKASAGGAEMNVETIVENDGVKITHSYLMRGPSSGDVVDSDFRPQEVDEMDQIASRNDLGVDHFPAVHVLGDLRDTSAEVDGLRGDCSNFSAKDEVGRLSETDRPVFGQESSPLRSGPGAGTPDVPASTVAEATDTESPGDGAAAEGVPQAAPSAAFPDLSVTQFEIRVLDAINRLDVGKCSGSSVALEIASSEPIELRKTAKFRVELAMDHLYTMTAIEPARSSFDWVLTDFGRHLLDQPNA